jgi:hypothetical protein
MSNLLSKGYIHIGVHIHSAPRYSKPRFECGDENGTLYKKVVNRFFVGDTNETAASSTKVLIGRVHSNSKKCFQAFTKGRCNVVVTTPVNDIVDGDEEILRLIDNIHLLREEHNISPA